MKLLLQKMNLFPYKVNFNYKRNLYFHTILSQIFSMLLYIILIFCLFKFSEDFLKKQNPKLSIKEKLFKNDTKINFTEIIESISFNFDITLYTNDANENLIEAIKTYFQINFDIGNYEFEEDFNTYYNDFQITKFFNLTNNYSKNNFNEKKSENNTNEDLYNFKYIYNISLNALIDQNTIFKFQSMPISISNSTIFPEYLNIRNYSLIDIPELKNLYLKLEDVIININTDFTFYSVYNEKKTSKIKIELNEKVVRFCSYDSIIDPDIPEFGVKVKENFFFNGDGNGLSYSYQLMELIEDTDWIFTNFRTKYIMQIFNWNSLTMNRSDKSTLDVFGFDISKKMKSETRIYKKIQNVLAEIGGISSILIVIGNIVLSKLNQITFEINIINNLFSNIINNKENLNNSIKKRLFNKTSNLPYKSFPFYNGNQIIEKKELKISNDSKNHTIAINDRYPHLNNNPKDGSFKNENNNSNRKFLELNSINKNIIFERKNTSIKGDNTNNNKENLNIENISINHQQNNLEIFSNEKIYIFLKEKKYKKKKNLLIKFSELGILKFLFCCKRFKYADFLKQQEFYTQGEKKINRYLDVFKLMKFFENFEILKSLILNKQQIFAFDYFKKRDLSELNKNKVENLQELYKYLKGIKEYSENHNLISDENITYFLDQDIKNFFSI